jgi:hypothetical protein
MAFKYSLSRVLKRHTVTSTKNNLLYIVFKQGLEEGRQSLSGKKNPSPVGEGQG